MTFNDFTKTFFELLELEENEVSEDTMLRDELNLDSLQIVNLTTSLADYYQISFSYFIENSDKIGTVGGLYKIVLDGTVE
nr:phosphopantetheine-binding protein [Lysinibacillus timonensis]